MSVPESRDMLDEMEPGTTSYDYWARMLMTDSYSRFHSCLLYTSRCV